MKKDKLIRTAMVVAGAFAFHIIFDGFDFDIFSLFVYGIIVNVIVPPIETKKR